MTLSVRKVSARRIKVNKLWYIHIRFIFISLLVIGFHIELSVFPYWCILRKYVKKM